MSPKTISYLIRRLNANKTAGLFLRPLSKNVALAKVWLKIPKPDHPILTPDGPDTFYFIKNEQGWFVGAVYDMNDDLQWYISPKYRKQGLLSRSLKYVILPHIFQNRDKQRITITKAEIGLKNFNASTKVALGAGFVKSNSTNGKDEYTLPRPIDTDLVQISGENISFSSEIVKEIRSRINYVSRYLWLIQTDIEMKLGSHDFTEELSELVVELRNHATHFGDNWYGTKN